MKKNIKVSSSSKKVRPKQFLNEKIFSLSMKFLEVSYQLLKVLEVLLKIND